MDVESIFDGRVFVVPGNHYAQLPSGIAAENHFGDVETRVREFLRAGRASLTGALPRQ